MRYQRENVAAACQLLEDVRALLPGLAAMIDCDECLLELRAGIVVSPQVAELFDAPDDVGLLQTPPAVIRLTDAKQ